MRYSLLFGKRAVLSCSLLQFICSDTASKDKNTTATFIECIYDHIVDPSDDNEETFGQMGLLRI